MEKKVLRGQNNFIMNFLNHCIIDKSLNFGRPIIRSYLEKSSPFETVLDLGAGKGQDLSIARSVNATAKLFAIELFEPNIVYLKEQSIEVYELNIEKDHLPFEDKSIDIIIANQILEHAKEIFWIMHEISRVLKVGGKLILGLPNLASLHNRFLLLIGSQPTAIQLFSAHIRGFTKPGLLKFLSLFGGYNMINFEGSNFYPFPPFVAKPLAKMFPSFSWGIFFFLEKTLNYSNEFLNYIDKRGLETPFSDFSAICLQPALMESSKYL
jgi:SAM-dependent methyltransferase